MSSSLLVSNKCFQGLIGIALPIARDVLGHGVDRVQLHAVTRKVRQRAEHALEVGNISLKKKNAIHKQLQNYLVKHSIR